MLKNLFAALVATFALGFAAPALACPKCAGKDAKCDCAAGSKGCECAKGKKDCKNCESCKGKATEAK